MTPSSIAKAWRQFWCQHAFNIEDIRRPDPDKAPVICYCHRCMKLCTAPYGLVLPGKLTRRSP